MNRLEVGGVFHQKIIENKSKINLFDISGEKTLDYVTRENAILDLNIFSTKKAHLTININACENSKLNINVAFINHDKFNLDVNILLKGNNITSNLYARGVNKKGKVSIVLNGENEPFSEENVINEYAKVINYSDDENILIPNLLVNSSGIMANHGISIGHFNEEEIFYLESKGIERKEAIKLLEEGFILYNLNEDEKKEIKEILGGEV